MLLKFRLFDHLRLFTLLAAGGILAGNSDAAGTYRYAVVISEAAYAKSDWKTVADSLARKHGAAGEAKLITWASSVTACKADLAAFKPDYIGYIARPATECNAAFVAAVSRLGRDLDDDPYGDAVWGIITGYEAGDALRAISESLTVKTVLAASGNLSYEPPLQRFYQGIGMTCDSYTKTDYLFPGKSGKIYTEDRRPQGEKDRIKLVGPWLDAASLDIEVAGQGKIEGPVDCIITGGHGNVNLWQCHYNDPGSEGYMQSAGGKLYGVPFGGSTFPINAATPKIFWCATNCLMGNPNSADNMVYAAFHTGHAVQMFGFVNSASGGDEFMAWGIYDRVTKSAGRYTLAEGFFLANNLAQFELRHSTGQLTTSLVRQYMDSTVFYGDPAGDVTFHDFGDSCKVYKETIDWTITEGKTASFTYTLTMLAHDLEFGTGYCYQFRPIARLPVRIDPGSVVITANEGHTPEINDNLLIWEMLAKGERLGKGASRKLEWTAKVTDEITVTDGRKSRRKTGSSDNGWSLARCAGGLGVVVPSTVDGNGVVRLFNAAGRELFTRHFSKNDRLIALPQTGAAGVRVVTVETAGNRTLSRLAVRP